MWKDEIVEEVRRARDEYAASFHYDLDAIFDDITQRQEQERLNGRIFVTLPPKRPGQPHASEEQPKAA